jgi:HEXXH motif-containing protein
MSDGTPSFIPPTPTHSRQAQLHTTLEGIEDLVFISLSTGLTPDGRSSVLRCYEQIRRASAQARAQVLSDVRTSWWVDRGSRLAVSRHPELLPSGPWCRHMADLGRFALATAVMDHVPFSTQVPVDACGQIVLPGAGALQLASEWRPRAEVAIEEGGGITVDGATAHATPITSIGGFQVITNEPTFQPRHVKGYVPLVPNRVEAEAWVKSLSAAREIIDAHTPSRELITAFATTLVPLEPAHDDKHLSVSLVEYPGVVYLAFSSEPLVLAEALVHEADHQWHYAIEQKLHLWRGARVGRPACYRSPWRPDPRPLDGLLLGASAFVSVGEMFVELALNGDDYAGSRSAFVLCQSLDALSRVKAFGDLTDAGLGLMSWLELRATEALDRLKSVQGFDRWHENARARINNGASTWETEHGHPDYVALGCLPFGTSRFPGSSPTWPGGALEFSGVFIDLDKPHAPAALLEVDGLRDALYRMLREDYAETSPRVLARGQLAEEILRMEECWLRRDFDGCVKAAAAALRVRPQWVFLWWRLGAALRAAGYATASQLLFFDTDFIADIIWPHINSLQNPSTAASIAEVCSTGAS